MISLLVCTLPADAVIYNIPQKTLQIAREASANPYINTQQSKLVRVGIGNQNFNCYERESISIYGTGEFEVYNGKNYINTFDNDNTIKVSMVGKIFVKILIIMLLQRFLVQFYLKLIMECWG